MHDKQQQHDATRLVDEIFDRVSQDENLTEEARELLHTVLAEHFAEEQAAPEGADTQPIRAFLKSIQVRGFRGIGPAATLDINPGPGLTVVCGRNGSGKSSFSEALELALTGNTYRWSNRAAVWTENWRNLHTEEPAKIRIGITEEGQGVTTVGVDWAADSGLENRSVWVQRPGAQRQLGTSSLGWESDLNLYRPILSYDELGGLLESGPSKLFDKIAPFLGIEDAHAIDEYLAKQISELKQADKDAKAEEKGLKAALFELDDERARNALAELNKKRPDLDTIEGIATGTTTDIGSDLAGLRDASRISLPSRHDVIQAANALQAAATKYHEAVADAAEAADQHAMLLQDAITYHDSAGDGACPVCGQGSLDAQWRVRVETELEAQKGQRQRRESAGSELLQARKHAEDVVHSVVQPPSTHPFAPDSRELADTEWQAWAKLPSEDHALAEHMKTRFDDVHCAMEQFREEAESLLKKHEDRWSAHATRLSSWLKHARKAQSNKPRLKTTEAAREFMKKTIAELRETRLKRLEDGARAIWAGLKQESNVDLGAIKLASTGKRRRVDLRADVDGSEGQALGVMSQGELHALALALFLPRAATPGSPFGFVVLDDPIQAMDPSKVDSFVRVLSELAADRQVIVFSHDDRLPRAIRDLHVNAHLVQVLRDNESSVTLTSCHDPARRNIDDALALCQDSEVPEDVLRRVLPGLCRDAVEAAAREVFMNRRFNNGESRETVEETWQDAHKTQQRLKLAIDDGKEADISRWIGQKPWRKSAVRTATRQAHGPIDTDPKEAVRDVEKLVQDILGVAR